MKVIPEGIEANKVSTVISPAYYLWSFQTTKELNLGVQSGQGSKSSQRKEETAQRALEMWRVKESQTENLSVHANKKST